MAAAAMVLLLAPCSSTNLRRAQAMQPASVIVSIAAKIGATPQTLLNWVRKHAGSSQRRNYLLDVGQKPWELGE